MLLDHYPTDTIEGVGVANKPRFIVKVNDDVWPGVISAQTDVLGFNHGATFEVHASYSVVADTAALGPVSDDSLLAKLVNLHDAPFRDKLRIFVGYDDGVNNPDISDPTLVFTGCIDKIKIDLTSNLVTLVGRDLTAVFLETYTYTQFRGKTTVEVIQGLCDSYGFKFENHIDNPTPIGKLYEQESFDFDYITSQGFNNWDIITKFAINDAAKSFFINDTLFYVPYEFYLETLELDATRDVTHVELEKNFSIVNSRLNVTIASNNTRTKDSVIAQLKPSGSQSGAKGDSVNYYFVDPTLTKEQAELKVSALALYLSQLEHVVNLHMPGRIDQTVLNRVILQGLGKEFSLQKPYNIYRVAWNMDFEQGWQTELTLLSVPDDAIVQAHRLRLARNIASNRRP